MGEDKSPIHSVEASKKRSLEEGEGSSLELGSEAVKDRHFKRPRMEPSTSRSPAMEEERTGRSERTRSQGSGGYGSEEGEVDEGPEASGDAKTQEGELLPRPRPGDGRTASSPVVVDSSDDSSDGEHVGARTSSPPSSSEPHRSGWNKGIRAGQVRTSLSSLTQKTPSSAPITSLAPVTATAQPRKRRSPSSPPLDTPDTPGTPPTPSHFQKPGISLKLPPAADRNPGESWQVRFQEWTNALLELNPGQVSLLTPETILDAYSHFIDRVCTIHNKKKRAAKAGADLCSQKGSLSDILASATGSAPDLFMAKDAKDKMGQGSGTKQAPKASSPPSMPTAADWDWVLDTKPSATLATPAQTPNDNADGNKSNNDKNARNGTSLNGQDQVQPRRPSLISLPPPHISIPVGDEELDLQHRYFPHMSDVREMCILCLQHGHKALSCPSHACKHCGAEYKHSSYACPSKRRCAQCKGLGHTAESCTEDHNWDTDLPCAHCGENHLERDCDFLWRTYRQVDPVKKAHSISAFCATCGGEGHYYTDCALASHTPPKSRTWSQANLARCFDKASKRGPISEFKPSKPSSELRRPELVGRSSENIYFESDDSDGDAPFIGNRVQPKQSVGRISVSSNIHFGGQAGRSSGLSSAALPPRPQSYADTIPGENRQQDSSRHPHQLPPRPPASRRGGGGGGGGNYQAVPPPPALQWNPSQGNASRDNGSGNPARGGRGKNPSRGGRGGGRGNGRGGGGNSRSSRGGKW